MPDLKLTIATPIDGAPATASVHVQYALGLTKLLRSPNAGALPQHLLMSCDIVRARNRAVELIRHTDATHVLWWDEDVDPGEHICELVNAMLLTGHPIIGAPYPQKNDRGKIPHQRLTRNLEATVNGCVPIAGLGFGFMLTRRDALEAMWVHYERERWFYDVRADGSYHRGVGLFDLQYSTSKPHGFDGEWRERLSEDYSFCLSALQMGLQPMMYVGPYTPLRHIGEKSYEAQL